MSWYDNPEKEVAITYSGMYSGDLEKAVIADIVYAKEHIEDSTLTHITVDCSTKEAEKISLAIVNRLHPHARRLEDGRYYFEIGTAIEITVGASEDDDDYAQEIGARPY